MTDERDDLRKQIADEVDKIVSRAAIFSEGVQSPFWRELKEMFAELERKAFLRFTDASAADIAVIIELQQVGKLGRVLESKVLSAISEAEALTQ